MNKTPTKYLFKIHDIYPCDIPISRLLEYLGKLKKILGSHESLSLTDIKEGSVVPEISVRQPARKEVSINLRLLQNGNGSSAALKAYKDIDQMLNDDGLTADLQDEDNSNIINFPGTQAEDDVHIMMENKIDVLGVIKAMTIVRDYAKIEIDSQRFGIISCITTLEKAKEMRGYWTEQISIFGKGMFERKTDGKWHVKKFEILEFTPLKVSGLRETIDSIRALNIDTQSDLIKKILDERAEGQIN